MLRVGSGFFSADSNFTDVISDSAAKFVRVFDRQSGSFITEGISQDAISGNGFIPYAQLDSLKFGSGEYTAQSFVSGEGLSAFVGFDVATAPRSSFVTYSAQALPANQEVSLDKVIDVSTLADNAFLRVVIPELDVDLPFTAKSDLETVLANTTLDTGAVGSSPRVFVDTFLSGQGRSGFSGVTLQTVGESVNVNGDVLVDGEGPVNQVPFDASTLVVGESGQGQVSASGGATFEFTSNNFDNVEVGSTPDGEGTLNLTGPGTKLKTLGTDNAVFVGREGQGTLRVEAGAEVSTLELSVGRNGNGEAHITGLGSVVSVTPVNGRFSGEFDFEAGFVEVGRRDGSVGALTISEGGQLEGRATDDTSGPGMNIARNAGSRGEVVVDDATVRFEQETSLVQFGPFINVGRGGNGEMTIRNDGRVLLEGPESDIIIGRGSGEGTLTVNSGGRIEALFFNVGFDGGTGTMTLKGDDTILAATGTAGSSSGFAGGGGFLTIGEQGTGTVDVLEGATIEVSTDNGEFPGITLGRNAAGDGQLNVSGSGSTVIFENTNEQKADSTFNIGDAGSGSVSIDNGATVEGVLFMTLGRDEGSTGTLTISGPSSEVNITGTGGPASSEAGQAAFITVGRGGEGTLEISDGGLLTVSTTDGTFPGINAARNEGSQAAITIEGTGSRFEILGNGDVPSFTSGQAIFGRSGTADITISNGGAFSNQENGVTAVGVDPGSGNGIGSGTVTVTGDGSLFDAGSNLVIGVGLPFSDTFAEDELDFQAGGVGSVTIGNGGKVRAGDDGNDGVTDIFVGADDTLIVESGGTLIGDVRVVGGTFDVAEGATHQGDIIMG